MCNAEFFIYTLIHYFPGLRQQRKWLVYAVIYFQDNVQIKSYNLVLTVVLNLIHVCAPIILVEFGSQEHEKMKLIIIKLLIMSKGKC